MTAAERVRAGLDAALADAGRQIGATLEWDAREREHVEAAIAAAEVVDVLDELLTAEREGERRPSMIVKLAAEQRLQRLAVSEHLRRLNLDTLAPEQGSRQHSEAARARWGAERPKRRNA
jgi:hypothetical protein